jgi:hypothetical protein
MSDPQQHINETHFLNTKSSKVYSRTLNIYYQINLPVSLNSPSVLHKGQTYLIGGGIPPYSSCHIVNSINLKSTQIPSLNLGRYKNALISHQNEIFTIGGINQDHLDSVERFDGEKWTIASSLNHARADCSCCSVKNSIFVFGGFSLLDTIERFDGSIWHVLKISLPTTISRIGSFYYGNSLFFVGGNIKMFRSNACNKNVYRVDLEKDSIEEIKSLPVTDCFDAPAKFSENKVELIGQRYYCSFDKESMEWDCKEIQTVCGVCFKNCGEIGEKCRFIQKLNFIKIFMVLRSNNKLV